MKKYSLDSGRIIEFEYGEELEELEKVYKAIMQRSKGRKMPPLDESLIAIDLACINECTCSELINDTTDDEALRIRTIIRDFVNHQEGASIPYIIYRESMCERICIECTLKDDKIWWRVLRMDGATSADIKYLVNTMKNLGIYDLSKL